MATIERRKWYIGDALPAITGTVTGLTGDLTGYTMTGRLVRTDVDTQNSIDIDARCSITSAANKTYQVALAVGDITVAGIYMFVLRFTSSGSKPFTLEHTLQLEVLDSPFA